MLRSLVGSEMCIRDRLSCASQLIEASQATVAKQQAQPTKPITASELITGLSAPSRPLATFSPKSKKKKPNECEVKVLMKATQHVQQNDVPELQKSCKIYIAPNANYARAADATI